jgi:lysophospholipase L1-like esterase
MLGFDSTFLRLSHNASRTFALLSFIAAGNVLGACQPGAKTTASGATTTTTAVVAPAAMTSSAATVVPSTNASTSTAAAATVAGAGDAGADAANAALSGGKVRSFEGKVILHIGDSMVGGQAGLNRGLEQKFKAAGAKKYVSDTIVSLGISSFAQQPRFKQALARHSPDIVIITLGANDVFVPHPETFQSHIESIVKKASAHECLWISPATWKKDSGIVDMIKEHAAPCKFHDSRDMDIPRAGDRIHPTDKGGAIWADKVWEAHFAKE